jgi:putative MATE family efflux protein
MQLDLTRGKETRGILLFSLPIVAGNLLQQLYNVSDTLIVGKLLGPVALASVGSAATLMVFLTSILLGLCMGCGVVFSQLYGAGNHEQLRHSIGNGIVLIGFASLLINALAFWLLDPMLRLLSIPDEALSGTRTYLLWIFAGFSFTFIYNYIAAALRSIGNSLIPLVFLAIAAVTNIVLDILFIIPPISWGVAGAAIATVIAQALSALSIAVYAFFKVPELRPAARHFRPNRMLLRQMLSHSSLTSLQQSIMNFGILMIQGLVNSFGIAAMAAFAAAVKIDAFAYMPVQDFGNAFATFAAQNKGAKLPERIRRGLRASIILSTLFSLAVSALVCVFAKNLMLLFIDPSETEVLALGVQYLRIEGLFYPLIGWLFLLYALYRGLGHTSMSIVLTVISLGIRVALAYLLAPIVGLVGIWWSIPLGWAIADAVGFLVYGLRRKALLYEPG